MRAVLDTNVLISGLLWRGPPHTLLERARDDDLLALGSHDSIPIIDPAAALRRSR